MYGGSQRSGPSEKSWDMSTIYDLGVEYDFTFFVWIDRYLSDVYGVYRF
mgnify:CR=1 FL=1